MDVKELDLDYQVKKEELFKEACFLNKYSKRDTNMSEYSFRGFDVPNANRENNK